MAKKTVLKRVLFQSTSSVWRTTFDIIVERQEFCISIHVLRVEDDAPGNSVLLMDSEFQSTSSVWRTTFNFLN